MRSVIVGFPGAAFPVWKGQIRCNAAYRWIALSLWAAALVSYAAAVALGQFDFYLVDLTGGRLETVLLHLPYISDVRAELLGTAMTASPLIAPGKIELVQEVNLSVYNNFLVFVIALHVLAAAYLWNLTRHTHVDRFAVASRGTPRLAGLQGGLNAFAVSVLAALYFFEKGAYGRLSEIADAPLLVWLATPPVWMGEAYFYADLFYLAFICLALRQAVFLLKLAPVPEAGQLTEA